MFSDENDFFFSMFGCILKNVLENILQYCAKYRVEGVGGVACVFGKWFTKKLDVNHFLNFNKGFSGQRKLFSVWPPFYSETNTRKSENIFQKLFYSETNEDLMFSLRVHISYNYVNVVIEDLNHECLIWRTLF